MFSANLVIPAQISYELSSERMDEQMDRQTYVGNDNAPLAW